MTVPEEERPEAVLERLLAFHPHARRRRSLAVVDAVCRAQHEHGSQDFTLATIGRLSASRGGPAQAALANPMGAPYREIILAHQKVSSAPTRAAAPKNDEAEVLAMIRDPLQRAMVRTAFADARRWSAEAKKLLVKANTLQALANASATLMLEDGARAGDLPSGILGQRATLELLPIEKAALANALGRERLARLGIRLDAHGRVLNNAGKALFPVGFATALAKIGKAIGVEIGDASSVTSPA